MMVSNGTTVIVTITDYTTIFPNHYTTTSILDAFSTLTRSLLTHTTNGTVSTRTTFFEPCYSSVRSALTSSKTVSSSLLASSVVSNASTSVGPALPTGWPAPTPSPTPQEAAEKYPNNTLPILMILWLIFVALFFLGALIYFAWRLARGHCVDCSSKDAEIVQLKKRLVDQEHITPAKVHQRESLYQDMSKGQEVSISAKDLDAGITFRLKDPEQGITVNMTKKSRDAYSRRSEQSDAFNLEKKIPAQSHFSSDTIDAASTKSSNLIHKRSSTSIFLHGLSTEQNRSLALHELTKPPPTAQNEHSEISAVPFWKRAFAHVGLKAPSRPQSAESNGIEDLERRKKQPTMHHYPKSGRAPVSPAAPQFQDIQRTYPHPGPAPAFPVPIDEHSNHHRPVGPNPYTYNPRSAYFEDDGGVSSGRGNSNTVLKQYPLSQPTHGEFITVGLDDQFSANRKQRDDARRAAETRGNRRTGGYGGLAPIVPLDMDGDGQYPTRV